MRASWMMQMICFFKYIFTKILRFNNNLIYNRIILTFISLLLDNYNNYQQDYQHHNGGGGDADRVVPKKGPLLPIPGKASPFSNSGAPNQSPGGGPPDVATSTAQAAAVNLSKILNALRSNAVTATRSASLVIIINIIQY